HGEAYKEQDNGDNTAKLASVHGRADHRKNHPRVNRMTDPAVRPGANELMFDLDGYGAAPVPAKMSSGPDGEQQAGRGDRDSQVHDPEITRQDAQPHPAERHIMSEHPIEGGESEHDIWNPGTEIFSGLCALAADCPQQPDHEKDRPQIYADAHFVHR